MRTDSEAEGIARRAHEAVAGRGIEKRGEMAFKPPLGGMLSGTKPESRADEADNEKAAKHTRRATKPPKKGARMTGRAKPGMKQGTKRRSGRRVRDQRLGSSRKCRKPSRSSEKVGPGGTPFDHFYNGNL